MSSSESEDVRPRSAPPEEANPRDSSGAKPVNDLPDEKRGDAEKVSVLTLLIFVSKHFNFCCFLDIFSLCRGSQWTPKMDV